ncbi:DUF7619 domain-containing protein [Flavobacterium silvaticum]|uniref:T9SS type A sorting domain-containing protein n=1 Tax=Flavobacterium silvaticum TaxID=1852020 RepID=A0A972JHH7_9FLAO|nr:T9SS type A sorting domain-containing protein [Flavobacterium silvaticum]NMH27148.1 T9SS type A sorting domain-containing protein [Flavobacterium silvaticum]
MKKKLLLLISLFSILGYSQCLPPTAGSVVNYTQFTATLSWASEGASDQWGIYVVLAGSPSPDEATVPGYFSTTTVFTIADLNWNTCYDFYVKGICGSESTPWVSCGSACTLSYAGCGGTYADSGGPMGNYAPNSDETITICPESPGDVVTVTFNEFNVETYFDALYVFDGNTVSAPQIASDNVAGNVPGGLSGGFWGNVIPGPFSSSSIDGCLTFRFRSDFSNTTASGWIANVTCGPPLNSLELFAYFDANANGTKDASEEFFTKGTYEITSASGNEVFPFYSGNGYAVTAANPFETYNVSFTIDPEFAPNFTAPSTQTNIAITGVTPVYFPIVAANPLSNMEVSIYAGAYPNAGTSKRIIVHYANTGNTQMSGTLHFTSDPALNVTYTVPPYPLPGGGFSIDYDLDPFQQHDVDVYLNVPSIPTVSIGQPVQYSVSLASSDDMPNDNVYSVTQSIVASYDPNDIAEAHGPQIDIDDFTADDYLYYTIRFQNTGNAQAMDVRLENTLDAQIDPESLRVVSASHDYQAERIGNQLTFRFDHINLPYESQNDPLSHGFVTYKVKLNPGFTVGDIIPNVAEIYFDTNPEIVTNTFETEFVEQLSTADLNSENVLLYPNPASQYVSVKTSNNTIIRKLNIIDMVGKSVMSSDGNGSSQLNLDISKLSKGVYLMEISADMNLKTIKKLIVQ